MVGMPAIGPTGKPLIGPTGKPAICKEGGCCGGTCDSVTMSLASGGNCQRAGSDVVFVSWGMHDISEAQFHREQLSSGEAAYFVSLQDLTGTEATLMSASTPSGCLWESVRTVSVYFPLVTLLDFRDFDNDPQYYHGPGHIDWSGAGPCIGTDANWDTRKGMVISYSVRISVAISVEGVTTFSVAVHAVEGQQYSITICDTARVYRTSPTVGFGMFATTQVPGGGTWNVCEVDFDASSLAGYTVNRVTWDGGIPPVCYGAYFRNNDCYAVTGAGGGFGNSSFGIRGVSLDWARVQF